MNQIFLEISLILIFFMKHLYIFCQIVRNLYWYRKLFVAQHQLMVCLIQMKNKYSMCSDAFESSICALTIVTLPKMSLVDMIK